jgi:anaphase-promoting complex subunit 3
MVDGSAIPTLCSASTSATAHLTLAILSHKGKAPESAVQHYIKALEEESWLWEAFTGQCDIGELFLCLYHSKLT